MSYLDTYKAWLASPALSAAEKTGDLKAGGFGNHLAGGAGAAQAVPA